MKNICNVIMGQSPDGNTVTDSSEGIEFHQGKVFFTNRIIGKSAQTTIAPSKIAPEGSVLLCVRAPVGKVNLTDREICIGRGLCSLKPFTSISIDFLYYLLETYESIFVKQATGTTFIAITGEVVNNQLVPIPPLSEQQRIINRLEILEPLLVEYDKCEKKEIQLTTDYPDNLKKSILQHAIQGKLVAQNPNDEPAVVLLEKIRREKEQLIKAGKLKRDKTESFIYKNAADNSYYEKTGNVIRCIDEELPFDIPESWEWVRLREVVFNHGQKTPDDDFCYIDIGSINNKQQCLNKDETILSAKNAPTRARKIVKIGDILYSTVRPYLHNICIVNRNFSKQPIASTGFAVMTCKTGLLNTFLFYYLLSPAFDNYANDTENAKGVAYPAINDTKLYNALIPIPPFAEQKRIVERAVSIFNLFKQL